jgi:hypothetical protein
MTAAVFFYEELTFGVVRQGRLVGVPWSLAVAGRAAKDVFARYDMYS